jgi:DNA-directed RNA polymerase specialized sigma24 family protein
LETLVASYWKPVYKYIRRHWHADNDEAKDLTQGFFAALLERDLLERYDAGRAALRTYLRVCVDGFVANERKAAGRQKRGGGQRPLNLDFVVVEAELAQSAAPRSDADAFFTHEWTRSVFGVAVSALRTRCAAEGKNVCFALFERYDLHDPTARQESYADLAREFSLPVTQVTNGLAYARRMFRALVLETLRELTASDAEFRDEARRLLGVDLA